MKCSSCQHEQPAGNFCGVCGTPFSQVEAASPTTALATVETPNGAMKNVRNYWNDSLRYIRQPLEAFRTPASGFTQGVITLLLYMVSFTLSLYFLLNSFAKVFGSSWLYTGDPFGPSQSLPFYEINSRVFLFSLAGVVISLLAIVMVTKLLKYPFCVKTLTAQYGALLTPLLLVNVISILFALSGTAAVTLFLLSASMFYALLVVPILFIYHQGLSNRSSAHVFYGSIGTSVIILFFSYFFWRWQLIEKLSELQTYLEGIPF
ncbi:zinc ribbon domain-containing protein [Halobacillus sp. A5]|uniref:zinc ribbon domain-containing protein n=1 Tax=Halobacillus sp. A5 TaxID=2880263 RepID=UPI0020A63E70|nr:zinc ribbon domain-containing protein [Halobacillus sp. A5]MCP3027931.1 zinc ribbon domain-containing protein [Halobacillus sp. A5]